MEDVKVTVSHRDCVDANCGFPFNDMPQETDEIKAMNIIELNSYYILRKCLKSNDNSLKEAKKSIKSSIIKY